MLERKNLVRDSLILLGTLAIGACANKKSLISSQEVFNDLNTKFPLISSEGPCQKTELLRTTIVNKSGYPVYIRMNRKGCNIKPYYLEVQTGTATNPTGMNYLIQAGIYDVARNACGEVSSWEYLADMPTSITFTPCGQ